LSVLLVRFGIDPGEAGPQALVDLFVGDPTAIDQGIRVKNEAFEVEGGEVEGILSVSNTFVGG
jgi:hypothetical protein